MRITKHIFTKRSRPSLPQISYLQTLAAQAHNSRARTHSEHAAR